MSLAGLRCFGVRCHPWNQRRPCRGLRLVLVVSLAASKVLAGQVAPAVLVGLRPADLGQVVLDPVGSLARRRWLELAPSDRRSPRPWLLAKRELSPFLDHC